MLETILESARRRAVSLVAEEAGLREAAAAMPPARDFAGSLLANGLQVIAEIKRRSPSGGDLAPELDAAAQAGSYGRGGAAAISVLTEPDFFGGSVDDLRLVREAVDLPVLRKDFVVDPVQVWESRAMGADVVLLIAAVLSTAELEVNLDTARRAGIAALVEVHTAEEAAVALRAGGKIIGVNNRDLRTFATDLAVAESIAPSLADAGVKVAESGVSSPEGAARMARAGYDAVLVGEAAVTAADPEGFVAKLREAAS